MKRFYILMTLTLLMGLMANVKAQSVGDYRTVQSNDWTANNTWQVYFDSRWNNANNDPGGNWDALTVTIRNNHTITLNRNRPAAGNTIQNLVVDNGGELRYRIDRTRSLSLIGSVTGGGTVDMKGGSLSHSLTLGGDFLPGTFNAGNGGVVLNGNSVQKLGGYSFNDLTLSGGGDKELMGEVTINGTLSLNGAKLILGDYDLIIAAGASITGSFSTTNMIVTNGTGRLIKEGNTNADYQMLYPVGSDTYYSPYEITAISCSDATGAVEVRALSGAAPGPPAAAGTDLQKYWEVNANGLTITSADVSFTYDNAEVGAGGNQSSYVLQVYTGGAWVEPAGAGTYGANPMTASGITDISGVWTAMQSSPQIIYYSYRSGHWDDISTWTHDPGGTTHTATDIPGDDAKVIILGGRTVTLRSDISNTGLSMAILSGGFLNMSVYGFTNTLRELSGFGTLKLATVNFPVVTNNYFVTADGGTVEYNNASDFELPSSQIEYNHLLINGPSVATQKHNLNIHGNLRVKQGTYRINDNSNIRYQLTIGGDVTVDNGASISVGAGNTVAGDVVGGSAPFIDYYDRQTHRLVIYGDFTNNGTVRFTNQSYPQFGAFPNNGAVSVYFMGAADNTLSCNGQTDFYNLILDKGSDQTFKLKVYSSAYQNFRLFGRNSYGGDTSSSGGSEQNPNLRKALWIRTGTLELQGLVVIPSLTEGGDNGNPNSDFYIPVNGALVLNGPDVVVLSTADDYREVNAAYGLSGGNNNDYGINEGSNAQSFSIYGKVEINDGYFSTRESGGFITWDKASGEFIINGGVVDAKQFRAAGGADGLASYTQTGGSVILRGQFQRSTAVASVSDLINAPLDLTRKTDGLDGSKGTLNINNPDNIFSMSGGTIKIMGLCGTNNGYAVDIFSAQKNINVTGGTIEVAPQSDAYTFKIRSAAAFGNLIINRSGGNSLVQLNNSNLPPKVIVDGSLTVLEDITLTNGVFDANGFDVAVGGDFSVADGTTYTTGANRTIFNGSGKQKMTVNLSSALNLNKLIINKAANALSFAGTQELVNVTDSLIISNGELDDNGKTINVSGNIYNAGVHSGDGQIVMSGSSVNGNGSGQFNNILLNRTGEITFEANTVINGVLTFGQDFSLNIGSNNLRFSSGASMSGSSSLRYIKSNGNAGDGGVTFAYNSTTAKIWPIGVDVYTPATIGFTSAPTAYGDITVVPVNYKHPVITANSEALSYFWRVKSKGFSGTEGKVSHVFNYAPSDVQGSEAAYLPARYDAATYKWDTGTIADVDEAGHQINDWTTPTQSADCIDGDYTAGQNTAFGAPQKYYSRADGLWSDVNTWSTENHTGTVASRIPGAGDIVIIGNGNTVSLQRWDNTANRDPQYSASLQIEDGAVLDVTYNPASYFGMVVSHPSGNGKIRVSLSDASGSIFQFPGGDFSDFNANLGTTELYTNNPDAGTTYWLPDGVNEYGNLMITPLGGSNIIFPNNDVLILGDLTADGQSSESWYCPTWNGDYPNGFTNRTRQAKTITIKGDFNLTGGALIYYGNRDWAQDFVVYGDLKVAENAGIQVYNNASNQSLSIGGSLINDARPASGNGINRYRGCDFEDIPLIFFGDADAKITQSGGISYATYTKIESVTVDKGSSQATTLTMDITGTVDYASDLWLKLVNGTFYYTRDDNVSIYSGDRFTIPGSSGLTINTTNIFDICRGNNNDDDDVYLNGRLAVINGTVRIGDASRNINNDIEYSGSGLSEIVVQGGSLFVNGQIRRNPASTAGILKYNQSGGAVLINGQNTLTGNAKLELLNAGSVLNMSGGTITIKRGGGTTYGDLYLRPEISNVTGGEIIFDNNGTGTQNYLLDASVALNDLVVYGTGSNAVVTLLLSPLTLKGDLTLSNTYSVFDVNSTYNIGVTINGDFINNGVYRYYGNTTTFSGGTQQITGNADVEFYNLIVNPLTSLTLNKDVVIFNDLMLSRGIFAVGAYTIFAKANVINNSTYTSSGKGLVLNGNITQELAGTGTFARMELDNRAGAALKNDISVNGELALTKGVLNIRNNLLSLAESASVTGSFGVDNMIITNGVYSNKGVKKVMPSGDSPAFVFPIGVNGKYTPAVLDLSASSNAASIQIHPVDYKHPANLDASNVLDYFWTVESEALNNASGVLTFTYAEDDILGDEANYYAARLLVPGTSWTKNNSVDKINNLISFTVSGNNISGEYTAGLETAFPDNVPEFTSQADGDWSDPDIWLQTGGDNYELTGAPNGFIVVIDHEVALDVNFAQTYRSTIHSSGKLKIDDVTYGHNLGTVSGSGTLYLEQGNLPEGNYAEFLGCNNTSILEFGGTGSYGILSDLFNNAANLLFTGTGSRILPNADVSVCNQLVIDGPVLDNSVHNRTLYVKGSFIRLSGTFKSGSGDYATVSFRGSEEQFIGGFTGPDNALNNLEINNSAGLTLDDAIEVGGKLMLTNGLINTSSNYSLTISNVSTAAVLPVKGKATSYVNGPLSKKMNQSDSFTFPIGSDGVLGSKLTISAVQPGPQLWTAEYKRPNPTNANYSFPLTAINSHEYWSLSTPGGGMAKVQLGWDAASDITPVMTEHGLSDIRVVRYDGSNWQEMPSGANGFDTNGQVITNNRVSVAASGSDFTTATVNTNKPKVRFNPDGSVCDLTTGIKVELSSTVPTGADYELAYKIDGMPQSPVTVTGFPYYLPTPSVGVYELSGFKYDGKHRDGVVDVTPVIVFPSPTTADAGVNQSLQGLSQTSLDANPAVVGTGIWSIVSGTGGSFVDPTDPKTIFNGTAGSSYVLSWTITNGDCQSVDQVNIAFPLLPPHTWLGYTSNWFDTKNWSDGIVPDETVSITLNAVVSPRVDVVIMTSEFAQVNHISIASGATLTLNQGSRMTVNGDITMGDDNSLIIQNAYDNPASFIHHGTADKKVQVEWSYPKLQYLYLAHAVDGATVGDYGAPGTDSYVYSYPGNWNTSIKDVNVALDGQLTGYSAILAKDATITTSGLLYTGVQNAVLENRWNLLGNTFASYLDLTQTDAWDFGKGQQTIWYTKMNGGEATYIAVNMAEGIFLNGADAVMPPGQAFWVRSYEASTITLQPDARFHGSGGLKSGRTESPDVLKLQIANANGSDEMAIVFRSSGHEAPANNDSEKFKAAGDRIPLVFSLKGNKNMAINVLPELNGSRTVELGYNVGKWAAGNIELAAGNIDSFLPGVNVSLEDKSNGKMYDLRQNPSVVFTSDATTNNSRFVLHFSNVSTAVGDGLTGDGQKVSVWVTPESLLHVDCDWEDYEKTISIHSIDGKLMLKDVMYGSEYTRLLKLKPGIYVVNLRAESDHYQKKIVIR